MTVLEFIARRIALARKRRQLREAKTFLLQLADQIESGRVVERQWQRKVQMLEVQLFALESPDDIVRRGQQA